MGIELDGRLVLAVLVLATTAVAATWAPTPAMGDLATTSPVFVVGPQALLASGNVTLLDGDALRALLALAAQQGWTVTWEDRPGCTYDYVRGVAGYEETRSGGWNYYLHDGQSWRWQSSAASCRTILGEPVLWCWVEPDEVCAVWPQP